MENMILYEDKAVSGAFPLWLMMVLAILAAAGLLAVRSPSFFAAVLLAVMFWAVAVFLTKKIRLTDDHIQIIASPFVKKVRYDEIAKIESIESVEPNFERSSIKIGRGRSRTQSLKSVITESGEEIPAPGLIEDFPCLFFIFDTARQWFAITLKNGHNIILTAEDRNKVIQLVRPKLS